MLEPTDHHLILSLRQPKRPTLSLRELKRMNPRTEVQVNADALFADIIALEFAREL